MRHQEKSITFSEERSTSMILNDDTAVFQGVGPYWPRQNTQSTLNAQIFFPICGTCGGYIGTSLGH